MRFITSLALLPALALWVAGPAVAPAATTLRAEAPVVRDGVWEWPATGPHQVIRPFIAPPVRWAAGHRGVDLAAGDELLAPADGVVSYAGRVVDRGVLTIDHGDGVVSSYEPVTALVTRGDAVSAGEIVATVDPGHCTVACVHMGVRVDGAYVNPLRWLGGVPRAVLLPTRPID